MKKILLTVIAVSLAMISCNQDEKFEAKGAFDHSSSVDLKLLDKLTSESSIPSEDVFLSTTEGNYYFQSSVFQCKDVDGKRQYLPVYNDEINWNDYIDGDATVPVIRFSKNDIFVCQNFFSTGKAEYTQYVTNYDYDAKTGLFAIAEPFSFYALQKVKEEKVELLSVNNLYIVFKSSSVINSCQEAEYSIIVFEKRAEKDLAQYYNLYGHYKDYR
ncbi:MAG: hypothetical protein J5698_07310 [Bacteroidaceae bacterium]|nr:hypothetical protein [Bacteroidaceae bacterium]